MARTELTLGQLFENNFDCYTQFDNGTGELNEEMAMTKDKFIRIVDDLLMERKANHANKEKTNCVLPVVVKSVCPETLHKHYCLSSMKYIYCPHCGKRL